MSMPVKPRVILSCVGASLVLSGAAACSKSSGKSEMAKRAQQAGGEVSYEDEVTAVVEAVDPETRTVTLREPEGEMFTVNVGENVAIERMEPDDQVNVTYKETMALQIQEPGSEPTVEHEATTERLPEGVQYGRRVTTTVEILAVAPDGKEATFRGPEGEVRTVEVDDQRTQEKFSHLRPGDSVEVTYTERLALTLKK